MGQPNDTVGGDLPQVDLFPEDQHSLRRGIAWGWILTQHMLLIQRSIFFRDHDLFCECVAHLRDTIENYQDGMFNEEDKELRITWLYERSRVHPDDQDYYFPHIDYAYYRHLFRAIMRLFGRKKITPPEVQWQEF